MKKLLALTSLALLGCLPLAAAPIFSDSLNYPNGPLISPTSTNGLWEINGKTPAYDVYVSNNLILLNRNGVDSVAAPSTGYNASGPNHNTYVYASFTINLTQLPYAYGDYIVQFQDTNDSADVCHVFARTHGTTVPNTYQLGVANGATASSSSEVQFFPLDLATNGTYQVVICYNSDLSGATPLAGATLAVNPAGLADFTNSPAYGEDSVSGAQNAVVNQAIGFHQSGLISGTEIGNIIVGTNFADVFPYTPSLPVITLQPQVTNSYYNGTNLYVGDYWTFYTAASGLGALTYQWYSNGVPLVDDGTYILGSTSNILTISNLTATANYYVEVRNSAGPTDSQTVTLNVNTTPTPPFFTTQPVGSTNTEGAQVTLTSRANGSGPITYTWYFQATNTTGFVQVGTGATFTLTSADYLNDGLYQVVATGSDGSTTSSNAFVVILAPALVPISALHRYMATNANPSGAQGGGNLANSTVFTVQGVVTAFGQTGSLNYTEYRIQDSTGGVEIYEGAPSSQTPPVGTWVQAQGTVEQYYGSLEMSYPTVTWTNVGTNIPGVDPATITNLPLPAPSPLNLAAVQGANSTTAYGIAIDGSLVTVTNAYLYADKKGTPVSGTFQPGKAIGYYAYSGPYDAVTNTNTVEVWVVTGVNVSNYLNTNFTGVTIPSHCTEITGAFVSSSDFGAEIQPSRVQDFVTNSAPPIVLGIGVTNKQTTLTWQPPTNYNTYSVYSASSVKGPWTQTFGLGYYPMSTGTYTVTNTNSAQFFKVSSP